MVQLYVLFDLRQRLKTQISARDASDDALGRKCVPQWK